MNFATAYTPTDDFPGLKCLDKSRAVQAQLNDADINTIVKRFKLTGELPQVLPRIPLSEDFREMKFDLGEALRYVNAAEAAFMMYPAEIRAKFDNDVEAFCNFVEDKANHEECIRLGILAKPKVPEEPKPMKVEVVTTNEAKPKT